MATKSNATHAGLCFVAALALSALTTIPVNAQPLDKNAENLPDKVIEQFEKLDAEYGHFLVGENGEIEFETDAGRFHWWKDAFREIHRVEKRPPNARAIPGFILPNGFGDAEAAKLPTTDQPLGLKLALTDITDTGLRELARFSHLRFLKLSFSSEFTDLGISSLTGLEHLEVLDLSNTNVKDPRQMKLSHFKGLRILSLNGADVIDEMTTELGRINQLQVLDLSRCKELTSAGLRNLADLKQLRVLSLNFCNITDDQAAELGKFRRLELLHVSHAKITDAGLAHIAGLEHLRILSVQGCHQISAAGLRVLTKLKDLAELDLASVENVNDAGLGLLAGCANLRKLTLQWCDKITGEGLRALARLPHLEALNLSECRRVGDSDVKSLAESLQLQDLELSFTQITDEGIKYLAHLKHLRKLDLSVTRVGDAGLRELSRLRELRELILISCPYITDEGLKELVNLHSLTHLNLRNCSRLTLPAVQQLRGQLPNCDIWFDNIGGPIPLQDETDGDAISIQTTTERDGIGAFATIGGGVAIVLVLGVCSLAVRAYLRQRKGIDQ